MVELMVTVAIVGVLAMIAIPSFRETMRNNRVVSASNEVIGALNYMRSEAIKRGKRVTLCKSNTISDASPSCSTATTVGWRDGWIIFVDETSTGTLGVYDAGANKDTLLKLGEPISSNIVISPETTFKDYISYLPTGVTKGKTTPNGDITLCSDGKKRVIYINTIGRIRVASPNEAC